SPDDANVGLTACRGETLLRSIGLYNKRRYYFQCSDHRVRRIFDRHMVVPSPLTGNAIGLESEIVT
ncbi:MAG: hypothetical protein VCB59_10760, partial [Gammaproteobacteria bacterium]